MILEVHSNPVILHVERKIAFGVTAVWETYARAVSSKTSLDLDIMMNLVRNFSVKHFFSHRKTLNHQKQNFSKEKGTLMGAFFYLK